MVPTLTWSKGSHTGHYPYVGAHPGWYDGGPYADPMGHRYVRRYGYHEQMPAGYSMAPSGPQIITRTGYAPRHYHGPRVYAPHRHYRGVVVRARAEHVRPYRAPAKRHYQGY